ncbi:MAG TPA: hypothetical protein DCG75_16020 [Bacteroidales bacterium]|nr:hypothetical protein [Bacteroidales bacterium]
MKRILTFIIASCISIASLAQLTKEPYLIYTGNFETMKVMFQAKEPQVYIVSYGFTENYEIGSAQVSQLNKGKNENIFAYTFNFLKPNTKYNYRITDKHKLESYSGHFLTGKQTSDKKVYFLVKGSDFSDGNTNDSLYKALINFKNQEARYSSIILHTGNLVRKGSCEKSWNNDFFLNNNRNVRELYANTALLSTMGYNDAKKSLFSENKKLYRKYLYYPYESKKDCYYSAKFGNVKFIVLDQFADLNENSEQFNWLTKELESDSLFRKIVLMHSLIGRDNSKINELLFSLFETNNVKAVFTGNVEGYAHLKIGKIHCFSVGGKSFTNKKSNLEIETIKSVQESSFIAVKFEGDDLSISVFNADMEVIDFYSFE